MFLSLVTAHARATFGRAVAWVKRTGREAFRPAPVATGLLRDVFRSRDELLAESALLRQQLLVAARGVKRRTFQPHERGLLVLLSSILPRWRDALLLVKPETIIRWHRAGFRLFWKRKPGATKRCKSLNGLHHDFRRVA